MKTKQITQQDTQESATAAKISYPPYQSYFHHAQIAHSKQKLLTSLKQVGFDVEELQDKPVQQILQETENKLRKTYSVKVVAVKDGELGILSKRIDIPKKKKGFKYQKNPQLSSDVSISYQPPFHVHQQFQTKSLKSIKKIKDPQEEEFHKKLLNWQAEQFERMKGRAFEDPLDDEETKKLPKVASRKIKRKSHSPKNLEVHKRDDGSDLYAVFQQEKKDKTKISYSRLLQEMSEKHHHVNNVQLAVITTQKKYQEQPKLGGVIMELDEENEMLQESKLPEIQKHSQSLLREFSENDPLQKKLKKIQDKLKDQ